MLREAWLKVQLAGALWWCGVVEAVQLQRCIVVTVLDSTGKVLATIIKCFVLNGVIYLGSIACYRYITSRAINWLLMKYAEPVYNPAAIQAWEQLLHAVFQLLWLLPVYAISLLVSCIWYQQIAVAAYEVQQQQQQQTPAQQQPSGHQQPQQLQNQPSVTAPGAAAPTSFGVQQAGVLQKAAARSSSTSGGGGGSMMQVLEGTAQELFRVLLFMVFTIEVYFVGLLPFVGFTLNVLFLSWLYAYYCYDYKWSLQGKHLPARLSYFEANWAFFAGFGFPCVIATVLFPFHTGAALANMLFPVFILVASSSDPVSAQRRRMASSGLSLGRIPVFTVALRPTYWIIKRSCVEQRLEGHMLL